MTALIALIPIIAICVVAGRAMYRGYEPPRLPYDDYAKDAEWWRINGMRE